jgi:hypothetical protein
MRPLCGLRLAFVFLAAGFPILISGAIAQQTSPAPLRPPATPLVTHDPYFSVWSMANRLTDSGTTHWTGASQELVGIVRVDGKNYRFLGSLGNRDRLTPAMAETSHQITPTRTVVAMTSPEIELGIEFLTPAFPDDMAMMARPVTYLTWDAKARDGHAHDVTIYLDAAGTLATNDAGEQVMWSRAQIKDMNLLRVGTGAQPVLQRFGDNLRINWGWFYVGVPPNEEARLAAGNQNYRESFLATGDMPDADDIDAERTPQSRHPAAPALNVILPLGSVGSSPVARHVLLAYDDLYSVEYLHRQLLPYWRKQFPTFSTMIQAAERDYPELRVRSRKFDDRLVADLVHAGGPEYAAIATLAFQQAIAAHKLVEDIDGTPFFMPKENFSNGSISTVDVIYPSAPMFLLLNPKLVEAQLEPVLRYAEMPRWSFPFAPHDLGVYPLANGQLYGGGEETGENQMPVEESGNVLLLVAALAKAEGDPHFAQLHWPILSKWASYLLDKGFDPESQLNTDDFAGHLAHNTNLSIKAIEALAAYAQLARDLQHSEEARRYQSEATAMASKWVKLSIQGDHSPLAFDQPDSWSQKYNLVWDSILALHLFSPEVEAREISFYKSHLNPYGLPLDSRATYTKLDWEVWSASLATSQDDFQTLIHPVYKFLNETPDRVPMTDWYDTITARQIHFQARSVVGGVYIKLLTDPALWHKWAAQTAAQR